MNVVHQDRIKLSNGQYESVRRKHKRTHANVAVHDQADAEEPVDEGRGRAGGDEGGCGERDEASGEEALE